MLKRPVSLKKVQFNQNHMPYYILTLSWISGFHSCASDSQQLNNSSSSNWAYQIKVDHTIFGTRGDILLPILTGYNDSDEFWHFECEGEKMKSQMCF